MEHINKRKLEILEELEKRNFDSWIVFSGKFGTSPFVHFMIWNVLMIATGAFLAWVIMI